LKEEKHILVDYKIHPFDNWSGVLNEGNEELLYFVDTKTFKRITVVDKNGKLKYLVPLDSFVKNDEYIDGIQIHSLDSIFLYAAKNSHTYVLNRKGEVIGFKQLPSLTEHLIGNAAGDNQIFDNNHKLLIHTMPSDNSTPDTFKSLESKVRVHGEMARRIPYLAAIDNPFINTPKINYYLKGFYSRFIPENKYFLEAGGDFIINNNLVQVASQYSDSLYCYDNKTFVLRKAFKIKSNYTQIGLEPTTIEAFLSHSKGEMMIGHGMIWFQYRDPYRNLTYVTVLHAAKGSSRFRPWSIIALDEDFNQVAEFLIDANKYSPCQLLVTKEGILLDNLHPSTISGNQELVLFNVTSK
jgi:hypothetical protein